MSDDELVLDKKKKKTKKVADVDEKDTEPTAAADDDGDDLNLGARKKKKTKKAALDDADGGADKDDKADGAVATGIGASNLLDAKRPWPDYEYVELIDMVFAIMRERNPELAGGEKKKFVMKPPQVGRAGSKKTAFANFAEICRLLRRQPKHVLQFLMAEMGTTGSIDGNNCLIVKGRFQQKHFESVLRKYIKEYVTCHTCRSSDTELTKDARLFFLQCGTCGSRCSVAAIKSGYTAMVGKRAAIRRAQEATGAPAK